MKTKLQPTLPGMPVAPSQVSHRGAAGSTETLTRQYGADEPCVTVAGKWERAADGSITARGTVDEWAVADRVAAAIEQAS